MNAREIAEALSANAKSVAAYLCPNGKLVADEFRTGDVFDNSGQSLAISIDGPRKGQWLDRADTDQKGDLLTLWQVRRNISFKDAVAEAKDWLGIEEVKTKPISQKRFKRPDPVMAKQPDQTFIQWHNSCGISSETTRKLKVYTNGTRIVFPYFDLDGLIVFYKFLNPTASKEKKWTSSKDSRPSLFGWQAIQDDHEYVVITEGEKDCLTFWEQNIPALAVPRGAGSGGKQDWINYEFENLERFREIYICMDADDAGKDAELEIAKRLGLHRVKIIDISGGVENFNDANDVHQAGWQLSLFIESATEIKPDEIVTLPDVSDEIKKYLSGEKDKLYSWQLPWSACRYKFDSIPGLMTVWAGYNGHGKSVLLSHIMVDSVAQGYKWCIASMELSPDVFGARVYRQISGKERLTDHEISQCNQFCGEKISIVNVYGRAKTDLILMNFEYAMKRFGATEFVVDSLSNCGFAEDDYNGQMDFVNTLFEWKQKHSVNVHIVHHVRKGQTEENEPGKMDLKGTGGIADRTDNIWFVWRNKKREQAKLEGRFTTDLLNQHDVILRCHKQRISGVEPVIGLTFNSISLQYLKDENDPLKRYLY